ncbi:hypothetical protein E4P41_11895 [Geodermatophilus sp. DF01-2]|uniref:hypothetical protein n=1 Tax=Geodermatophilus sp. DF01-2 TaxID=2559610 RepID=UPI001074867A|nr:hypothetical protein [Geodermatophilus sp. DF01_2]TFV59341.1 hypothetical protein E4P41_11895 [Geodermatophilus sp. DF01_2]
MGEDIDAVEWWGVPWADALAAIGTMLAVVVTLAVLLKDIRIRRLDGQRAQAEKVTAWLEHKHVPGVCDPMRAVVKNASEASVFDVEFVGTDVSRVGPPGAVVFPVLPPQSVETIDGLAEAYGDDWGKIRGVAITFVDSAGRAWHRDEKGRLTATRRRRTHDGSTR